MINASNLKAGGGLQVADSICGQLKRYEEHQFVVVLSSYLDSTKGRIGSCKNVAILEYDIPNSFRSIILGCDTFLDNIVERYHVEAVLTIFGPSRWRPKVSHLSGFALAQLVIPESPYFQRMKLRERIKWYWWCILRKWSIKRSADVFWTENAFISERLYKLLHRNQVYTVSNYFNQIYDQPDKWRRIKSLFTFEGTTCLSISTHYPHKNFEILIDVVKLLKKNRSDFKVRFVLTFNESEMPVPQEIRDYFCFIGRVDVSDCPYLYEQSDIMFMPTLLECFTATYPEAMRMEVPIITTDLEFAQSLCGDAAYYYSAVDPIAAAEAIYKVATDKECAAKLVANGKEQLKKFDNYEQRADKLIKILEEIVKQ